MKSFSKFSAIQFKLLLILVSILFFSCGNDHVVLVNNGKSNYEIVFEKVTSDAHQNAATELQKYIHKISDVKLPIVTLSEIDKKKRQIHVQYSENDPNEVQIFVEDNNLFIQGGSPEALLNSVYVFLEEYLNCKWLTPEVENIPKSRSIEVDRNLKYNYTPKISTRTVHSRLFYGNEDFAKKHKVTTEAFPYYVPGARVHTFHRFLPENEYYFSHPEYYALRGNKRLPTQLCLTNPDVYSLVHKAVEKLFNENTDSDVISVSTNDNTQYCQCADCSKIDMEEGGPTGSLIRFVNKIAADFPEKTISTLAYQYTRKPSKTKPLENVLITLCSIECDRSAPITDACTEFADDLRGWRALTENIRIWDYTTQFTNFLAPFPNIHTLQPNIQFFQENNATWVFEQHSHHPSELFELRSYIMAKLLWNPNEDFDSLITEFTDLYYKEAGQFIKEYVTLIHNNIQETESFFLFLYGDPSQAFDSYLNEERLSNYMSLFDQAEAIVSDQPKILNRVKMARLSTDYAYLEACRRNSSDNLRLVLINDEEVKINPMVLEKLNAFSSTCTNNDITLMNEMGFQVAEYVFSYRKALEVASKPNKALGKKVKLLTKPKKYANEDPQTLTDGALGGNNFYANWLGFEGNHMEAVIDLGDTQGIHSISTAFLQVTNHIVFYPVEVTYLYSLDGINFLPVGQVKNDEPLTKESKINDIKYFDLDFNEVQARFVKIKAKNMNTPPYWHHAAGLPAWVFADEVLID